MASRPIGMRSGLNSSVSERIEREKQDGLAHASEKIWVEEFETGAWGASPPVAALPTFATAVYKLTTGSARRVAARRR